jgi:uncharacterized membrane protein YkoI
VSQGLIQPLDSILRYVASVVPGSALSARLRKDDDGVWTYTLIVLTGSGRYREVVVDARTSAIERIK